MSVSLEPQTSAWGEAFEHWVIAEFKKCISYARLDWEISYLRTKEDVELDLIVERPASKNLLIEIKSKARVIESDVKALETLGADLDRKAERLLLSNDPLERKFGGTRCLHWQKAIEEIFGSL